MVKLMIICMLQEADKMKIKHCDQCQILETSYIIKQQAAVIKGRVLNFYPFHSFRQVFIFIHIFHLTTGCKSLVKIERKYKTSFGLENDHRISKSACCNNVVKCIKWKEFDYKYQMQMNLESEIEMNKKSLSCGGADARNTFNFIEISINSETW